MDKDSDKDKKKIFSLDEYKAKLKKRNSHAKIQINLSDFRKTLTQNDEQISWLVHQSSFAKFRLSFNCLFYDNHVIRKGKNINTAFFIGFNEEHIKNSDKSLQKALSDLERSYIIVDATDKTYLQIINNLSHIELKSKLEAYCYLRDLLYYQDIVVIFQCFSKSKIKGKNMIVRELVKTLSDAHHRDVYPKSDLAFVDVASFFEKIWRETGEYASVFSIPGGYEF